MIEFQRGHEEATTRRRTSARQGSALSLLVLLLALPATVLAGPGDGIRQGRVMLRPAVYAEARYDSNVFNDSADDEASSPVGAPLLRLLPELTVETLPEAKIELRSTAQLELRQFVNDRPAVENQSVLGAHLDLGAEVGKDSWVGAKLGEQLHYQPEPGTNQQFLDNVSSYDRVFNQTDLQGVIRPGRGVLEFLPGYQLLLERFPDYDSGNRTIHSLTLDARWKFMPRTAIVVHSSYGWRSFQNDYIPGSQPLRATAGLVGQITPKMSAQLEAGYGNSFADSGESFSGVLGTARLTEKFTERMALSLGYRRDFRDSTWSSFYDSHLFDIRWQQQIAGQLQVIAAAAYELMFFSAQRGWGDGVLINEEVMQGREDHVLRGDLGLEWRPNEWLSASVGYRLTDRDSDAVARVISRTTPSAPITDASYSKHQVFTRVGVIY